MSETPEFDLDPTAAAGLTLMRRLVTALLVVMIVGFVVLIVLLVTRFPSSVTLSPSLPENITLPSGAQSDAVTFGTGWVGVVVRDETGESFMIFDSATGALRQQLDIQTAQ